MRAVSMRPLRHKSEAPEVFKVFKAAAENQSERKMWAEAFSTATYVHNRTPTRALGGKTPYEMLYGVKPNVAHLRAFGAPSAVVKPSELLKKLDDRVQMCFFVGYKYAGGYRVWDQAQSHG